MPYDGWGECLDLLSQISEQLGEIIERLDALMATTTDVAMSYDYVGVTVPANQNDYEVIVQIPASVTYISFNQPVSFRVNEVSATPIPWVANAEFKISPMRTERIYVTTGPEPTRVSIRSVLTASDMSRSNFRR
jgi:hypothetical protein